MKKLLPLLFLPLFSLSTQAQDFTVLANDPSGDAVQTFGLDAKRLSIAVDENADSLWFKIETHDPIVLTNDWGFTIAIDTNEVTTDGAAWMGYANNSIGYERKITFLNNSFFPPTFTSLVDHQGNSISQDVSFTLQDPWVLIVRLKLSDIDDDINMNIVAGMGSFDDQIYDDMPDATYISSRSILGTGPDDCSCIGDMALIYPNPAQGILNVNNNSGLAKSYRLFSTSGQLVGFWNAQPAYETTQINLDEHAAGFYFFQVENALGEMLTTKIVVID